MNLLLSLSLTEFRTSVEHWAALQALTCGHISSGSRVSFRQRWREVLPNFGNFPFLISHEVARWRNGYSVGLAINRSRVQILLGTALRNNLGQVVHTYVLWSPSSITWYRPKGLRSPATLISEVRTVAVWFLTHVQMLYSNNTSEEIHKLATYTAKSCKLLRASLPSVLAGGIVPRPPAYAPNACHLPSKPMASG